MNKTYTQYCSFCNRTIHTRKSKTYCKQCEGLMSCRNITPDQKHLTKLARLRGFKDKPLTST